MNPKVFLLIIPCLLSLLFPANKASAAEFNLNEIEMQLQHSDLKVNISAVEELGKIGNDEAVTMLMRVLEDRLRNWKIRKRAIQTLADIKNYRAVDLLIQILVDSTFSKDCPALKWNAAIALGNFKEHQKVVDALIEAMNDRTLYIREAAIQSLGDIGNKKALPYLISVLADKNFAIRISAIRSLYKIGDIEAIPFLKQIADSDMDEYIRAEAVKALYMLSEKKS